MFSQKRTLIASLAILIFGTFQIAAAQDIQVSRANKTIEVTVTQSVEVDAELAVIEIGYQNYGPTKQAAFDDNIKVASRITRSLLDAGIPKTSLETKQVRLERLEPDQKSPPQTRAARQFQASQAWDVHVPVSQAQGAVDLAVRAGANGVEDIDWTVKDPDALEDKAATAALSKAHSLATQMAASLGAKLGELLYASNTPRRPKNLLMGYGYGTASVSARQVPLTIYPKKVEREAKVHAIFALQ